MQEKLRYHIIIDYEGAHKPDDEDLQEMGVKIAANMYVCASLTKRGKQGNLMTETYNYPVGADTITTGDIIKALDRMAHEAKQTYNTDEETRLKAIIEQLRNGDFGDDVLA